MPETGSVLAFDFGLRRIGVAVGELLLGQARALVLIESERNDQRFARIAALINEWQPIRLIVGRPCHDDGRPHEMTARCQRFATQLEERYHLPVTLVDERFSSAEAESRLTAQGLDWRSRKERLDALAAEIILQDYFDTRTQ